MAGTAKLYKKPNVVVEEFETQDSDDDSEDAGEEETGDDMVEIKEEAEDADEFSEDHGLLDDSIEVKSEDDDIREVDNVTGVELGTVDEVKEEEEEEDTSDDMGDDSSGESDSEIPELKKKVKEKKEKHVKIMAESTCSDESDTDSGDVDDTGDDGGDEAEKPEVKDESDEDDKAGLADVMAQILATPGGNGVMLSKAKRDYERSNKEEETGEFEFVDADGNVKKEVKILVKDEEDEVEKARKKLREKDDVMKRLKLKPNFEADREKERKLRIIATQGVVQLFSAIEKHKVVVRKERSETKSLVAREEISASELKSSFLDILDEEGKKLEKSRRKKFKREAKDEPIDIPTAVEKKPKWSVFADNFYKEPTLQGWDLKSDEDE